MTATSVFSTTPMTFEETPMVRTTVKMLLALVAYLSIPLLLPVCAANPEYAERVVRLPGDYSIGRAFIVEPPSEDGFLWHEALVLPKRMIPEARGDIEVPAGKMLRLDIMKDGRAAASVLRRLNPNDVQILHFYFMARGVDDRALDAIAHLTGLRALFASNGSFSGRGLAGLAGLKQLKSLAISSRVSPDALKHIKALTSLEYLNISGKELTDDKLEIVGQMPWLTQLSIAQLSRTQSLRYIAKLKSLRYLNLQAVRDRRLDENLKYISDLTELEEVNFENSLIGDAGLAHMRNMKKLRKLDLFSNPSTGRITENGLAHLTHLIALEDVRLPSTTVTDKGLGYLAKLDSLRRVNLWSRHLTDRGLAVVAQMRSLEDVDLSCSNITDAGLASLCRGTGFKSLSISQCKVTDAGLAKVANLESLEYFALAHIPIRGAGLSALKHCPSLKEVSLRFVEIQGDPIEHIAGIPTLERLRFSYVDAPITDESLQQLSKLMNLETLSIVVEEASQMAITDAGIRHLARLKNLEHIWLNHCEQITDEGLKRLEGLGRLKQLRLDKSRVTMAGVDRLKAAIPDVSVTVPATMQSAARRPRLPSIERTGRTNGASPTVRRRR